METDNNISFKPFNYCCLHAKRGEIIYEKFSMTPHAALFFVDLNITIYAQIIEDFRFLNPEGPGKVLAIIQDLFLKSP